MAKNQVNTDQVIISLKKAHSLLAKIITMKEESRYCMDIMQQNLAVIGLLKSINQNLMAGHLNSCFKSAVASGNLTRQKEMINEILQLNKMSTK